MPPKKRKELHDGDDVDGEGVDDTADAADIASPSSGTEKKKKKKKKKDKDKSKDGSSKKKKKKTAKSAALAVDVPEHNVALFCGTINWTGPAAAKVGKKQTKKAAAAAMAKTAAMRPDILSPTWMASTAAYKVDRVVSGCVAYHAGLLTTDGTLLMFGRNDEGQLGLGHADHQDTPVIVDDLQDQRIVSVAMGRRHTVVVTASGTAFATGDNKCGQLGTGNQKSTNKFVKVKSDVQFVKVSCGADFTVLLDAAGGVWACGHPEHGQLGNNTDGKYFITASKLTFHWVLEPTLVTVWCQKDAAGRAAAVDNVVITDICCGANHTIALASDHRAYSWGFGGYGRLGHSSGNTEMVPRMIDNFANAGFGAKMIAAGGTCSLAVTEAGQLMFWGQIKQSGEANTYPKPEYDLSGWDIKKIAVGNKHIVVFASDGIVSWAAAPTYGELGYGEGKPKSSTKPKIVETLEDVEVQDVACGYAMTMYVAKHKDGWDEALEGLGRYEARL
eukprot:m.377734 g.377734  ORF g.377734 m.377734 type:complete len:501 (+) comp20022_c1_seq14:1573-3075(+)